MDKNELLADLKRKGKNVDWLVGQMKERYDVSISESTFYKKLRGESIFNAGEIKAITKVMGYSNDRMNHIFFKELVS